MLVGDWKFSEDRETKGWETWGNVDKQEPNYWYICEENAVVLFYSR